MYTKKTFNLCLLVLLGFILTGCTFMNSNRVDLTLKIDGDAQVLGLYKDQTVQLPIPSKDDFVFVGWSDGNQTYIQDYTIQNNTTLNAVFEDADDHFTYSVGPSELYSTTFIYETIRIHDYIGDLENLVIPQKIDGKYVDSITSNAFTNTPVKNIFLPMDILVGTNAFEDASALESVRFYGTYEIPYEKVIAREEMLTLIEQHKDNCAGDISTLQVGVYPMGESCPIKEVIHIQSMNVGGTIHANYRAILDASVPKSTHFSFVSNAFNNAMNLHTLEIPYGDTLFLSDVVYNTPNLKTMIVSEEHPYFTVLNNVLFSKDMTQMLLYPSGIEHTSYTIPQGVESLPFNWNNPYLETIVIPNTFGGRFESIGLPSLKQIEVEQGHSKFQSIDGVLYSGNTLIQYPSHKSDVSFVVPNGITRIGNNAFNSNQFLTHIDLNQVTHIGNGAFEKSESIVTLELPASVISIGNVAINGSGIQSLIIHRSVVIDGSLTTIPLLSYLVTGDDFVIYVPDDSLDAYKTATNWVNFASYMKPLSEYQN